MPTEITPSSSDPTLVTYGSPIGRLTLAARGGSLVGAALAGKRVLILDDVLTAGTAIRESLAVLRAAQAQPVAVIVALDRQETVDGGGSALSRLAQDENLTATSVVTLDDLLQFVGNDPRLTAYLPAMQEYRRQYGVTG